MDERKIQRYLDNISEGSKDTIIKTLLEGTNKGFVLKQIKEFNDHFTESHWVGHICSVQELYYSRGLEQGGRKRCVRMKYMRSPDILNLRV